MTSGNPMVDEQEQYDIDSTSSYQEELNTLEDDLKITELWSLIYENALIDIEDRRLELPLSVFNHMKDVLGDKYTTQQELIMEKRQAVENYLSSNEFEE